MVEHIFTLCAQLEREQREVPNRVVVSPPAWEALRHAHPGEAPCSASIGPPRASDLVITKSSQLASGFALYKGDKLLKMVP